MDEITTLRLQNHYTLAPKPLHSKNKTTTLREKKWLVTFWNH